MSTFSDLRKKAGFRTQELLADALKVKSRAVVARWETGENFPRAAILPKIAAVLNVTEGDVIYSILNSRRKEKNMSA